jgi:hypothetical protein
MPSDAPHNVGRAASRLPAGWRGARTSARRGVHERRPRSQEDRLNPFRAGGDFPSDMSGVAGTVAAARRGT